MKEINYGHELGILYNTKAISVSTSSLMLAFTRENLSERSQLR